MSKYTQENKLIKIETPLGEDVLLLQEFNGTEEVSGLFEFKLKMISEQSDLNLSKVLGMPASIIVRQEDDKERTINGVISSFQQGGTFVLEEGDKPIIYTYYFATLVPWLWLLTQTQDCRIFQNINVVEIIKKVFSHYPFAKCSYRLHGDYRKREYCVQYRESDFNFVSRLMEDEGIFYFFEHDGNSHTLVIADNSIEFKPCPLQPEISYKSIIGGDESRAFLTDWTFEQNIRPGNFALQDFYFRQPSRDLKTVRQKATAKSNQKLKSSVVAHESLLEIYDYPGIYNKKDEGDHFAKIRLEESRGQQFSVNGVSSSRGFEPGYRFNLEGHFRKDFNQSYMSLKVEHEASMGTAYRSAKDGEDRPFTYKTLINCIPYPTPYRPPRTTPVPFVQGTQTAIVVGPGDEEIYVNEFGQVRVQFHWDRIGRKMKVVLVGLESLSRGQERVLEALLSHVSGKKS
jgi:type VI secretion system secreted protein VgrG